MQHTFLDENSLKTLEDYAVILTANLITLITLQNIQIRAIEIGIMPEDMKERANTMIWDIRRIIKHYNNQLSDVLALLPDEFNADHAIKILQEKEITKARSMIRKRKQ